MNDLIKCLICFCATMALIWPPEESLAQTSYVYGSDANEQFIVTHRNTTDNSYYAGGFMDLSTHRGLLANIDDIGNLNWVRQYTHSQDMEVRDFHVNDDGTLLVLCSTLNTSTTRRDALLMEVNSGGGVNWARTYVNTGYDIGLNKITPISTGDYLLSGNSSTSTLGSYVLYRNTMIMVDATGSVLWERREGVGSNLSINNAVETSNGKLIVAGHGWHSITNTGNYHNGYVAEIDPSDGSIIWDKIYASGVEVNFYEVRELGSGELAIVCRLADSNTANANTTRHVYIRMDDTGVIQFAQEYDVATGGNFSFQFQIDDQTGHLFFAGSEQPTTSAVSRQNYWLEVDDTGNIIDAYKYDLSDVESSPQLVLDDTHIALFSTTKSFLADPSAAANNDFLLHLVDRSNPMEDCNAEQFTIPVEEFSFSSVDDPSLSVDDGFSVTVTTVIIGVDEAPFQQQEACVAELEVGGFATDAECADNGSIDAVAMNGVAPYAFNWSNGQTTEDISGLGAGTYVVTVTDDIGATATASFEIVLNEIFPMVFVEGCDGMGTYDVNDDVITIFVDASGMPNSVSNLFNVVDASNPSVVLGTFSYNDGGLITVQYTPGITLELQDVDNPECVTSIGLDLQPCSPTCDPSLSCPGDIFITAEEGCETIVDYGIEAEVCEGYSLNLISGLASGSAFPLGNTVVSYELTDNNGFSIVCSFNVNVSSGMTLYGIIGGNLVYFDQATGDATQIAPLSSTFAQVSNLTYIPNTDLLYAVADGGTDPKLISIDRNSGFVTVVGQLDEQNPFLDLQLVESLAYNPNDGQLYVAGYNLNPSSNWFRSPRVGTVDYTTGDVTYLYDVSGTCQDDADLLSFAPGYSYIIDGCPDPQEIHNFDTSNGNSTIVSSATGANYPLRGLAVHPTNFTHFSLAGNANELWTVDLSTSNTTITVVGPTHTASEFGGGTPRALAFAPNSLTLSLADVNIIDVPCGDAGMIDIDIDGGIEPYTYVWSDGSTSEDLSPIMAAGVYSVTVTDACGNTMVQAFDVGQEDCPCEIFPLLSQDGCDGMGTSITSDDLITLKVEATANFGGPSQMFEVFDGTTSLGTFPYGGNGLVTVTYAPSITLVYQDVDNPECNATLGIDLQPCSPFCNITPMMTQVDCDDNGTPADPSDDIITIQVDATTTVNNPSMTFDVFDSNFTLLGTFPYAGGGTIMVPYSTFVSWIFADSDDPDCIAETAIDLQPCESCEPTLTCPDDMYVTLGDTGCDVVVDYSVMANDCPGYTLTLVSGLPSGAAFPLGTTTVTYQYSDGTNTLTCSFNVNVSNVTPGPGDFVTSGFADPIADTDNCFQLTTTSPTYQYGSVWYQKKLDLNYDFDLSFDINLGSIGSLGADGMVFVLQPLSTNIGGSGGYLGFGGPNGITTSVGIEFDTWQNSWAPDPANDHISFQKNGNLNHNASGYLDASVTREVLNYNIEDGNYHPVRITWNATTHELTYIFDNRPPRTVTQDIVNTIFNGDANVYWGWTAGTGYRVNNQSVCVKELAFTEAISADATITAVPCEGEGSIDLMVSGGVPGYTFDWSDGSASEDLTGITMGGTYSVTITDACGNTLVQSYDVEQEDCPCEIFPLLSQDGCDGMGTSITSDDLITLKVEATANFGGPSQMFEVFDGTTSLGTFPYGGNGLVTVTYAPSITLVYQDVDNPECNATLGIDLQPCSPFCNITPMMTQVDCDDNGTPADPSDDIITIQVDATTTVNNPSMTFDVFDSNFTLLGTFPYAGGGTIMVPYSTFVSWIFADSDDPDCIAETAIDLQPCESCEPTLTCPDDMYVTLGDTGCDVVVDYSVMANDCPGYTLTLVSGLPSGAAFPLGTTTVTYQYSDGTNTLTCSFNVNVSNVTPGPGDFVTSGFADPIADTDNCFQLTTTSPTYQYGSVWYQKKLDLNYDFDLSFDINLGSIGSLGADGMVFVLQPLSTNIGGSGGYLGFGGPNGITTSVGIEFDTWQNSWAPDPANDHISFQKNGNLNHNASGYLDASVTREVLNYNIEDGNYHPVRITWNATTHELTYIFDNRPPRTVTQDIVNTIFNGDANVYWGWTAGTGYRVNNQSVCVKELAFTEAISADANIVHVPCDGLGMIDLTVSGGVPGYTFEWSDGSTDEDLSPIAMGGTYSVTITDACGNTLVQSYDVEQEICDCTITATLLQEGCDGMGTSDTSDDVIYIYVDASAVNGGPSNMFNVLDATTFNVLGTFTYGSGGIITIPYAPFISLIYEDVDNPECNTSTAIDLQPCSPTCTDVNISITLDNYPKETSWELVDVTTGTSMVIQSSNGHLGQNPNGITLDYNFCLPDGCYEFTIFDSYGDGICCDPFYGNGSYTVTDMTNNVVLGSGGQFGYQETTAFCFGDVTPPTPCTYETIKNNTFENGWGVWNDGGEDCERINSSGIGTAGNWSIRLRDDTNTSVMTTNNLNMVDYSEANVEFMYQARSMDNSTEDFFLEISTDGGATFTVVEEWNEGDEFQNTVNYTDAVTIPGPFTSTTQFRFRCDASGDADYVYIDKVIISGCKVDPSGNRPEVDTRVTTETVVAKPDLALNNLFPNPATDYVNVEFIAKVEGNVTINVYNMTGQWMTSFETFAFEGKNQFRANLDRLDNGTYIVELNDGKKTDVQRLVIMK